MELWQIAIQGGILISLTLLLASFLKQFNDNKTLHLLGIIPLIFTIGFSMRLTSHQNVVDLGYYLTDISYLFTYVLFTAALILGQKKYWNIK